MRDLISQETLKQYFSLKEDFYQKHIKTSFIWLFRMTFEEDTSNE